MVKTDDKVFNIFVFLVSFVGIPLLIFGILYLYGISYYLLLPFLVLLVWTPFVIQVNKEEKLCKLQGEVYDLKVGWEQSVLVENKGTKQQKQRFNNTGYYNK
jgi:hypothetical protein